MSKSEYDLTKRKNSHLERSVLVAAFKKRTLDFLPFFKALSLFSRLFQVWKITGQN